MEIKVGGTSQFYGQRYKIAAKYTGPANGYILEITDAATPRWKADAHVVEVIERCVPALDPDKYYYWVPDVYNYKPPQRKKVYK